MPDAEIIPHNQASLAARGAVHEKGIRIALGELAGEVSGECDGGGVKTNFRYGHSSGYRGRRGAAVVSITEYLSAALAS